MCLCIYIYIYVYIHVCVCMYIYIYIYTCALPQAVTLSGFQTGSGQTFWLPDDNRLIILCKYTMLL